MVKGLVTKEGTNQSTKHILIFISKALSLYNLRLDLTRASTYSGARPALFGVNTLPSTLNTCSLLLLAKGWGRWPWPKKARRGKDSSWIFHQQISHQKCMKLTKFISWEGNPERSWTFWKIRDRNFRLILSWKIPKFLISLGPDNNTKNINIQ